MSRDAGWRLSVYPSAGEAGGSFRSSLSASPDRSTAGAGDPERSAVEAARRARSKLRRYCAANGLNRLGTLTYRGDGCHDAKVFRSHLGEFFRELRPRTGGEAFPYAWVPEWHKSGHGLHAHFAVGKYVPRGLIEAAWGRGFVHITLLGGLPVGTTSRGEARVAARYLSKYIGKDFSRHVSGLHRYDVAQGFQPQVRHVTADSPGAALRAASDVMGARPDRVWWSGEEAEWDGPPVVWASWR